MTPPEEPTTLPDPDHGRLVHAASVAACEAHGLHEAVRRTLVEVCRHWSWPVGRYVDWPAGSEYLEPTPLWHLDDTARYGSFRRTADALRLRVGAGVGGSAAATGRLVTGGMGAVDDPHRAAAAAGAGLSCVLAAPVTVGPHVVGVLEFFAPRPMEADAGLIDAMARVGRQLGRVVERARTAQALADSEERMRLVVESTGDAFVGMDAFGRITDWNAAAESLFGWCRADAIGRRVADTIVPTRYRSAHDQGLVRYFETGEAPVFGRRLELDALRRDGSEVPVELVVWPVRVGDRLWFNAFVHDISDRRAAQAATRRFRIAFDDAPIGMVIADITGRCLQANRACCGMLGYSEDQLARLTFADLTVAEDVAVSVRHFEQLVAGEVRHYRLEQRYVHADGHRVWVLLNVSAVPSAEGGIDYLIGQIQDISEVKQAEAELAHRALHDPLTGLANRSLLMDRLHQAVRRSSRDETPFAVMFIDLDGFKEVNDDFGHGTGDEVLVGVAERLVASVRPADTTARLGGDEFVVVCEGVDDSEVRGLAARIAAAVHTPFVVDAHELRVNASVGAVIAGPAAGDPQALLREADAAMYRAKRSRPSRLVVVDRR